MKNREAVVYWIVSLALGLVGTTSSAAAAGPVGAPVAPRPAVIGVPVAGLSLEAARDKVLAEVYQGRLGTRALFAHSMLQAKGSRISGWKKPDEIVVDRDSWFFFVDEHPGANWEHPARYILVDKATGAVRNIPAKTPPRQLRNFKALNDVAIREFEFLNRNARAVRERALIKPVTLPVKRKYAVLVSGGWDAGSNYGRYWNDLSSIYKALKQKYRYRDDEIIVLYANGTHNPNADLDGDGVDDVDYSATKTNLTTVMSTVGRNLARDGKFFFYSTNHGGHETGHDAYLYLWGEWIRDDEFAALSKKIVAKDAIYVMEQCYSGGMADDLLQAQTYPCTRPRVCVMTAARHDEVSWGADTEGAYDEYVYHWTAAVYGRTPNGTSVNADSNGDGVVTMSEAHEYAKSHDSRNEHPLIGSCVTNACNAVLADAELTEDCVSFNPATSRVALIGGRWKIVDGNHLMFDFGTKRAEAQRAFAIIRHYRMNRSCFVGRPNPSFRYLLVSRNPPSGAMSGEDCVAFNPRNAVVRRISGRWKIVDGNHWMFDFGANRVEAEQSLQIIKKYGFTRSCFVGRPGPSFTYLRR